MILENIDHNLAVFEIPAQLACAYLKGHLKGQALDWFEGFLGYRVIEDKTTDYAHLKQALSKNNFPWSETGIYVAFLKNPCGISRRKPGIFFHILDNMQYQCILGIDFMKASRLTLDFDQKSLIIPDHLIKQMPKEEKLVEIDLKESKLDDEQQRQLKALFNNFKGLFSDQPGLTHVVYHEIDTGDKRPVVSRPYKYDRVKQGIIDYHIDKMLRDSTICPINSPYASPVVLTRKNNDLPPDSPEAYRFAIDYRKLNAITKYPRYPLPVIDDLLTNIPHTNVMSTLDLRSGYFQLAISPKDIEKTAFITRNGTFAFLRMPFGLSGAAPNFQRAIDIILQPVIGRFVSVYMDDVIITSPSFKDHLDHLTRVFTLLRDAGLTLNKEKCHFARDKLKYLGLIISKEGIETDNKKIRAITEMKPPKNNR
ncbi:retrovirus-related Pol polyprotein from transposon opus, partial [Trichonephila clavipes]